MLGNGETTTNFRMGMAEIGAGIAVAGLIADASIIPQNTSPLGMVFLVGRHRSTS
jgi:hypothetical protein